MFIIHTIQLLVTQLVHNYVQSKDVDSFLADLGVVQLLSDCI